MTFAEIVDAACLDSISALTDAQEIVHRWTNRGQERSEADGRSSNSETDDVA